MCCKQVRLICYREARCVDSEHHYSEEDIGRRYSFAFMPVICVNGLPSSSCAAVGALRAERDRFAQRHGPRPNDGSGGYAI
jgi:hypothetical protein